MQHGAVSLRCVTLREAAEFRGSAVDPGFAALAPAAKVHHDLAVAE
jgi:hypothetical protein